MAQLALLYQPTTLHIVAAVMRDGTYDDKTFGPAALVGSKPTDGVPVRDGTKPKGIIRTTSLKAATIEASTLTPETLAAVLVGFGTCAVVVDGNNKVTGVTALASPPPALGTASPFSVKVAGVNNTAATYALFQHAGGGDSQEPDTQNPASIPVQGFAAGDLVLVLVKDCLPAFVG